MNTCENSMYTASRAVTNSRRKVRAHMTMSGDESRDGSGIGASRISDK